jgi:hypothetical protein
MRLSGMFFHATCDYLACFDAIIWHGGAIIWHENTEVSSVSQRFLDPY